MKRKRVIKGIAISMLAVMLLNGKYVGNVYAEAVKVYEGQHEVVSLEENSTRSAKTYWVYKKIDGQKFMRLYDASNGKWLTPWLLCP